jgi:carbamoyltransferase
MIIHGINDSSHDAALSVIKNGEIVFAAHSERYNKEKNTFKIDKTLLNEALEYGKPDEIAYFEKTKIKKIRKAIYGGINGNYINLYSNIHPQYLNIKEKQHSHHYSHACAGYYTSPFTEAVIVVIDAIGEFETTTAWEAKGNKIKKIFSQKYPTSYGLFYSAFTDLIGLKAGTEEYILMGMSAYGNPHKYYKTIKSYFPEYNKQKCNFHRGVKNWPHPIQTEQDRYDIAAATQKVFEERLSEIMKKIRRKAKSKNLVYMGGCALNCTANTQLYDIWDNIWIMPNPGDAGSSLGAALATYGQHIEWKNPYLGHNIEGNYPVDQLLKTIIEEKIVAVANGPAEFGPRSLGNRSLLADPRYLSIQDLVNTVKQREKFRPFAPVVTEEDAHKYFDNTRPSPYMQYTYKCLKPELLPGTTHVDGTSRIQTVNKSQHPGLYELLKKWETHSGVPILLNTSLNIKNQPILNDKIDVGEWEKIYKNVKIFGVKNG